MTENPKRAPKKPKYVTRRWVEELEEASPDLKRLRKWVEERVDLKQAKSVKEGRKMIKEVVLPGPKGAGVRKVVDLGFFDLEFFEARTPEFVAKARPARKIEVPLREWRDYAAGRLARSYRAGRMRDMLLAFSMTAKRSAVMERLARKFGRSPVTLSAEFAAMRAAGWFRKVGPGVYLLTGAGRKIVEDWTE